MKHFRLAPWFAVAGLALLSAGVRGAAEKQEDAADPRPATAEEIQPATGEREETAAEVFQPTEEISEDYAAPFPVDI